MLPEKIKNFNAEDAETRLTIIQPPLTLNVRGRHPPKIKIFDRRGRKERGEIASRTPASSAVNQFPYRSRMNSAIPA